MIPRYTFHARASAHVRNFQPVSPHKERSRLFQPYRQLSNKVAAPLSLINRRYRHAFRLINARLGAMTRETKSARPNRVSAPPRLRRRFRTLFSRLLARRRGDARIARAWPPHVGIRGGTTRTFCKAARLARFVHGEGPQDASGSRLR